MENFYIKKKPVLTLKHDIIIHNSKNQNIIPIGRECPSEPSYLLMKSSPTYYLKSQINSI